MSERLATARIARAAGAELRRMRQAAGLTQRQLARLIESHHPIIGRTERGVHMPTIEVCELYAAVCGGSLLDVTRAVDRALGLDRLATREVAA